VPLPLQMPGVTRPASSVSSLLACTLVAVGVVVGVMGIEDGPACRVTDEAMALAVVDGVAAGHAPAQFANSEMYSSKPSSSHSSRSLWMVPHSLQGSGSGASTPSASGSSR